MSVTPNMLLNLPDPTVTPGPEWAAALNAALAVIDGHDHTSDMGKQVPISGVDINQDLDMVNLSVTNAHAVNFQNLVAALSGALNINRVHVVNGDIWFTNAGGVPVQITSGNAIVSNIVIPSSPLMPSGTVLDFAGGTAPVGFLVCDGAEISRATYSDLFAAIGTIWGSGDGFTTFNLPNTSGRTSVGKGTYNDPVSGSISRTIGQTTGAEAHILTSPQMPSHTHIQDAHTHQLQYIAGSGATIGLYTTAINNGVVAGTINPNVATTATNQSTGGSLAHNNMQPSIVFTKMIKT